MGVPKDDMAQYGTDPVDAAAAPAAVDLKDVTDDSTDQVDDKASEEQGY